MHTWLVEMRDRKGHAAIEGKHRDPLQGGGEGERCSRWCSYVNPDRYVKEIRLWIQRRRERKRGGEREGVWCVRHVGSIHRLRVKMGRIGSWAWLSRSASLPPWPRWEWLTLVTTVNVARQASMKRPEWPWSDELPVTSTAATSRYAFAISHGATWQA